MKPSWGELGTIKRGSLEEMRELLKMCLRGRPQVGHYLKKDCETLNVCVCGGSVNMQISMKNKTWTGISVKVDPNDNTWNAKANIQVKSDAQEDVNLEEESLIFNCKQLNDSCTVTTYNIQNEPTIQSLELSDVVRAILQVFYGTLQMPSAVGSTDTSEISKSKEAEIYQSSED
ncbi:polyubiquitin-like [Chrysemys picta bellii]